MITAENLQKINEKIQSIPIKGKDYATVDARVRAFRELIPEGTISTEIIDCQNGVVTMKATIMDETGKVLATGMSYEKESNGYINKNSYIENCETSAVGRALGFLGIGINTSIASADEVDVAIQIQTADQKIDAPKVNVIKNDIKDGLIDEAKLLASFKIAKVEDMTEKQFRTYAEQKNKKGAKK